MQIPGSAAAAKVACQTAASPTGPASIPAPWYFTRDGKKYGPYTAAQLKQYADDGQLLPTDLVWKEGMVGWKPAPTVKGLFAAQQPPSQPAAPKLSSAFPANPLETLATPKASVKPTIKQKWQSLGPTVKLGIIGGAVAVPLVLEFLICGVAGVLMSGKSGKQEGAVAQKGGGKQETKEQSKGIGKPRSGSFAERALKASGVKERPAHLKPTKPGSTDDFIDALDILGCEPANALVLPMSNNGFPAGKCQVTILRRQYNVNVEPKRIKLPEDQWIDIFGEPEKLSDGYDITPQLHTKMPFQRWKYVLTDGPVTVHGIYFPQDRKFIPTRVCMY
jgi:hypothetical protein